MNLEILSYGEALKYVPRERSCAIRISNSLSHWPAPNLIESDNWVGIGEFSFDDTWPQDWKEYSWVDLEDPYLSGVLSVPWSEVKRQYPKMTRECTMSWKEAEGQPWDRYLNFNEEIAGGILDYYEGLESVENVVVHCNRGKNRAPAVGIAMNEIYGWGIGGLKDEHPEYRRYIYDVMMRVAEDRDSGM